MCDSILCDENERHKMNLMLLHMWVYSSFNKVPVVMSTICGTSMTMLTNAQKALFLSHYCPGEIVHDNYVKECMLQSVVKSTTTTFISHLYIYYIGGKPVPRLVKQLKNISGALNVYLIKSTDEYIQRDNSVCLFIHLNLKFTGISSVQIKEWIDSESKLIVHKCTCLFFGYNKTSSSLSLSNELFCKTLQRIF